MQKEIIEMGERMRKEKIAMKKEKKEMEERIARKL